MRKSQVITLSIMVMLALPGCNPGTPAPALKFDQEKVNEIRTQIDNFEWE